MSLVPDEREPVVVQQTQLGPNNPKEKIGVWKRFVNGLRTTIGLKPLYLTERYYTATVCNLEQDAEGKRVDNQVKLLKAKQDYELAMAEVREKDRNAEKTAAETRRTHADARIKELQANYLEARLLPPEEALERVKELMDRIGMHGGCVEIELPEQGYPNPDPEAN